MLRAQQAARRAAPMAVLVARVLKRRPAAMAQRRAVVAAQRTARLAQVVRAALAKFAGRLRHQAEVEGPL
jgi:hypothetical protein